DRIGKIEMHRLRDPMALPVEFGRRGGDGDYDLGIDRHIAECWRKKHVAARNGFVRPYGAWSSDDSHGGNDVVDASGDGRDRLETEQDGRKTEVTRHGARGRLETDKARVRCRPAARAAAVSADREPTKSGRDRSHGAAARAAWCEVCVPRISRWPEQWIVG